MSKSIYDYEYYQSIESKKLLWIKSDKLFTKTNQLLPNNKRTNLFDIEVPEENYKTFNFEGVLNNKALSDFKLIVGGKEFFVSKAILSSCSSVFEAMFLNDMKEKYENQAVIKGIESEVFGEFLKFIYLGKLDKMETMATQLLHISDMYNVMDLKYVCEKFIKDNLSIENSIQVLIIADKYNCEDLKAKAIEFIAINMTEIRKKKINEWLAFIKTNPILTDKIIQVLNGYYLKTMKTAKILNTGKKIGPINPECWVRNKSFVRMQNQQHVEYDEDYY